MKAPVLREDIPADVRANALAEHPRTRYRARDGWVRLQGAGATCVACERPASWWHVRERALLHTDARGVVVARCSLPRPVPMPERPSR